MTEEGREETHTHCWHRGMATYTSYPAQWDETCCHCGATQRVHEKPPEVPPGHGKHHPNSRKDWVIINNSGTLNTDPTRNCGCRVENGGSGVCGCILGSNVRYAT